MIPSRLTLTRRIVTRTFMVVPSPSQDNAVAGDSVSPTTDLCAPTPAPRLGLFLTETIVVDESETPDARSGKDHAS